MTDPIIISLILFFAAALVALEKRGTRIFQPFILTGLAGLVISVWAAIRLYTGESTGIAVMNLTTQFPLILGADRLSEVFILLLGILTIAISLYSPGYIMRMNPEKQPYILPAAIPVFLAGMLLVILSQSTILFLASWEIMAISSFFLVLTEYEEEKTRYAAFFYFAMTQLSTVCIFSSVIAMYLLTGSFVYPSGIPGTTLLAWGAFIFLFLGVAIKAGVIPFHKWLPYAHPAAPSMVSALMSGMMLNTALYILFRAITGFFLPETSWGLIILFFGCLTATLGVMYALKERDLKGLLAYSSIDNTGVILIGMGLFVVLSGTGLPAIGTMALIGAVFHAFSHGLFKGLLFLTAGSVVQAAGTRNIDELGGILVRMPMTGGLFLVGVFAISAFPPLNGFAGELLIYQSLFLALQQSAPLMQVLMVISLSLFGLTGAITAACFVKAFGVTFLALPRSTRAKKASEVPITMIAGPAVLAGCCILSGVFSSQILDFFGYSGFLPDLFQVSVLLILAFVAVVATVYLTASRETRIAPTWDCGMYAPDSRMEYTGSGYSQPVVKIFTPVYRTRISLKKDFFDSSGCFFRAGEAHLHLMKFFEEYLYLPAASWVMRYANLVNGIHTGSTDRYLLYVFIMVIVMILVIGGFV